MPTPPTADGGDSSSDESSIVSSDASSDEEEPLECAPVERKPAAVVPAPTPPRAAPPAERSEAVASTTSPKIDQDKLTVELLRYKWVKVAYNHRSHWRHPDGTVYKTTKAITDDYPYLNDVCAKD